MHAADGADEPDRDIGDVGTDVEDLPPDTDLPPSTSTPNEVLEPPTSTSSSTVPLPADSASALAPRVDVEEPSSTESTLR
eukprot:1214341-Rhodomonas_salina.1